MVVQNLTPVPRSDYQLGVPSGGRWVEVLNSDSEHYGGSNVGNLGGLDASDEPWHGQPASLRLVLPPLATVVCGAGLGTIPARADGADEAAHARAVSISSSVIGSARPTTLRAAGAGQVRATPEAERILQGRHRQHGRRRPDGRVHALDHVGQRRVRLQAGHPGEAASQQGEAAPIGLHAGPRLVGEGRLRSRSRPRSAGRGW